MGVSTTAALANLDSDDPAFFDHYYLEVRHRSRTDAAARLRGVIHRADMINAGIDITRTAAGPAPVPTAGVEIEFDAEWAADSRVYLWGARLRRPGTGHTAEYHHFAHWGVMDAAAEHALATQVADWLRAQRWSAAAAGESMRVFHWSPPERFQLQRILGEGRRPSRPRNRGFR